MNDPYRRIARFYDLVIGPPSGTLRRTVLELVPPVRGMRVLEVGCGTGANLEAYARAGCEVFGIDPSPSMLAVAHSKLGDVADLRLADAARLPFPDGSLDLVMAVLSLHEMEGAIRSPAVGEMARVASRDGRLLLIDHHTGPVRFPRGWLFKAVIVALELGAGRQHFACYRDFLARNGLPGLVEGHGLTVEAEKTLSAGNMRALVVRR